MRTCSECGTHYEDHVEECLVDGTELGPPDAATPAPGVTFPPYGAAPTIPPATPAPTPNSSMPLLLVAGVGVLLLIAIVVLIAVVATRPAPQAAPAPVPVVTVEAPVPPPPAPVAPAVTTVGIVSNPLGATVYEGEQVVCTTPCNIEHTEGAPLPRTFRFELAEHEPGELVMAEATGPFVVQLKPIPRAAPPPRPRPRPRPQPEPGPQPVAPAPAPAPPGPVAPRPSLSRDR